MRLVIIFAMLIAGSPAAGAEKDKPPSGKALAELLEKLESPDAKVRLGAIKSLLTFTPSKDLVPTLRKALQDSDAAVAEQAAKGLGWVGPDAAAAVPELIKLVETAPGKKTPLETRQMAIFALGKIGPAANASVPVLTAALAEKDLDTFAVPALIQIGPDARAALPALAKKMQPEKSYWLQLVRFIADLEPKTARVAIPDLQAIAVSEPLRDKGIVVFRDSQRRIEEARAILRQLEAARKVDEKGAEKKR